MIYIEAGELAVSNDQRYRKFEWFAGEPDNRLRRRQAARVRARYQPAAPGHGEGAPAWRPSHDHRGMARPAGTTASGEG